MKGERNQEAHNRSVHILPSPSSYLPNFHFTLPGFLQTTNYLCLRQLHKKFKKLLMNLFFFFNFLLVSVSNFQWCLHQLNTSPKFVPFTDHLFSSPINFSIFNFNLYKLSVVSPSTTRPTLLHSWNTLCVNLLSLYPLQTWSYTLIVKVSTISLSMLVTYFV